MVGIVFKNRVPPIDDAFFAVNKKKGFFFQQPIRTVCASSKGEVKSVVNKYMF